MLKHLNGVLFALPQDDEYDDVAHVWVRDSMTAYSLSLSRRMDCADIEIMVADQLTHVGGVLGAVLTPATLSIQVTEAAARALDGHRAYVVELDPDSDRTDQIAATLKVLFRGMSGLVLPFGADGP